MGLEQRSDKSVAMVTVLPGKAPKPNQLSCENLVKIYKFRKFGEKKKSV